MRTLSGFLSLLLLSTVTTATAQVVSPAPSQIRPDAEEPAGPNLEVPPGWLVRLDKPDESVAVGSDKETADIWFVTMTPGWHITSGPRAIYYHPASTAQGVFRARAGIHLFPPGERNEAYGLFVGGRDLQGPDQEYVYFLVRRSGEYLVKRRIGDATEIVHPWTAHDAVVPFTDETEGTIHNVLEVDAGAANVSFVVNGAEVASYPRRDLAVDGIVGIRLNHALNVHVDELTVVSGG